VVEHILQKIACRSDLTESKYSIRTKNVTLLPGNTLTLMLQN